MQLSEAIRLGAKLHPQGFGGYSTYGSSGPASVHTCAIGAAFVAAGLMNADTMTLNYLQITKVFPILGPDACNMDRPLRLQDYIVHLNDDLRMTREDIADDIEQIEIARGYFKPVVEEEEERKGVEINDLQPVS